MNKTMKEQRHRFGVGKFMTKTKGSLRSQRSIIEIHSHNRTVLINERSMKIGGNIGVVKGHQMFRDEYKNRNHTEEGLMNHPRAERSGNSLVVGRLWL